MASKNLRVTFIKLLNIYMWLNGKIKMEIKKKIPQDSYQWKYNHTKPTGCSKNIPKRDVDSNTGIPHKNKNPR